MKCYKNMHKKSLLITFLIVFAMLVFILTYAFFSNYNKILYPSYLSVIGSCEPYGEKYIIDKGYAVSASTISTYVNESLIDISVSYKTDNPSTLKHECCHVLQAIENRSYSCANFINKIGLFFNEFECYSVQDSDKIDYTLEDNKLTCFRRV